MRRWLVLLTLALAACEQAEGGAEDLSKADAGWDVVTFDGFEPADGASSDTTIATDVAETSPAEVAVDTMPADTSPHVCPTSATAMNCSKGTGTGEGDQCHDAPSCYVAMVQKAVNNQVATHPEWFDTSGTCPIILNVNAFLDGVVAEIVAKGYCAIRDPNAPNEEITIKRNNAFTENFDIVASTGCARSGAAIYTGFCAPAWW